MEFGGVYEFSHDRETVWRALNDPAVLKDTVPGCETLDQISEQCFAAKIRLKFGFFSFSTTGDLEVEVVEPAKSYRLIGASGKTMFGSGRGTANVLLEDLDNGGTHLRYEVVAALDGRLAKMGASLVSGQIQTLGTKFFERFEGAMNDHLRS